MTLRSLAFDGVLLACWLASLGMVALQQHGQLFGRRANPLASLHATLDAQEQWFGLYYQGHKIGFSHTTIMPEERGGVPGVGVMDTGRLAFTLMGTPQQLDLNARAFIDADWRLQIFTASVQSADYRLQWTGERRGDALWLTVTTPTSSFVKQLQDPAGGAFINGLSSWAAFHRLREGQYGKAWVINPLALSPEPAYFSVRERQTLDGQEVLVVETDISGMTTTTWVTPDGQVLKETSPLGWELRQETREDALKSLAAVTPSLDLLSAAAVSVDRPLEHPDALTHLTLLVEGADAQTITVPRAGQIVVPADAALATYGLSAEEPWCVVRLSRQAPPTARPGSDERRAGEAWGGDGSAGAGGRPRPEPRYQQPSLFVQSNDPRIVHQARAIVGSRTDAWEQIAALHAWVSQTLEKRLTIGLPSAVDVLAQPAGDCHEHTVLFTALARSLGIPTRMVAGLVYQRGRFYYHAWPEVWFGQWFATDPTLNQLAADATHLGLTEAEDERLVSLGQFLGALRLKVLESIP